ncbi:MAG TPA: hypothetical protein VGN12_13465 [Pirellulales bacterium]|jgi:hypothetical protein
MHRPTVGILALLLLIVGGIALLVPGDEGTHQNVAASCLRIGMILAVLWLALPELARPMSRWMLVGVVATVIVLAKYPRLIFFVGVFLGAIALLRPRLKAFNTRPR